MPRQKRSQMRNKSVTVLDEPAQLSPEQEAAAVTWTTYEAPRFWCPLCGMVANVSNLLEAPHAVHTAMQRYGGSFPGYMQKGDREVRRGYIQYFDEPDETTRMLAAQMVPIAQEVLAHLRELADDMVPEPLNPPDHIPNYLPPGQDELDDGYDDDTDDLTPRLTDAQHRRAEQRTKQRTAQSRPALPAGPAPRQQLPVGPEQKRLAAGKQTKRIAGKKQQKALPPPED